MQQEDAKSKKYFSGPEFASETYSKLEENEINEEENNKAEEFQ